MKTKNPQIMSEEHKAMVEQNYNLIHHVLKKFSFPKEKYEDCEQIGALALCDAAMLYDASKGYKFSTFAVSYIKFRLLTYFRTYEMSIIRLPLKVYKDTINGKKNSLKFDSYEGILDSVTSNWEPHKTENGKRNIEEQVVDDMYVQNVLATLTKEEAEMFDYLLEGYSQSDIAKIYNCSRANINIKIQAIRKKLKYILEEEPTEINLADDKTYERI